MNMSIPWNFQHDRLTLLEKHVQSIGGLIYVRTLRGYILVSAQVRLETIVKPFYTCIGQQVESPGGGVMDGLLQATSANGTVLQSTPRAELSSCIFLATISVVSE